MKHMTRLERWLQHQRAQLARYFEQYDIEALIGVSLLGVMFVWYVWLVVFG